MENVPDTAPREGSSLYYSLLWTPIDEKRRLLGCLYLIRTLSTCLDTVSDSQVAQHKLNWWHDQLQACPSQQAAHPAIQAAASRVIDRHLLNETAVQILAAAAAWRFRPPQSDAEANALLQQDYLARLSLLCHALQPDKDQLEETIPSAAATLACGLARQERLLRLPVLLRCGIDAFSQETLSRHDLSATKLIDRQPLRMALIKAQISHSHRELLSAMSDHSLSQFLRQSPRLPLWRWVVLRKRQLDLWQRKPPDLLHERSTLTPLVKLFWAWRYRR